MRRSTIIIYPRRRWLPRGPVLVAAILAGLAIGSFWPEADSVAPAPAFAPPPPAPVREAPAPAPWPAATPPQAQAQAQEEPREALVSTMVAPGVHVTPIGVPPGSEPVPAGPSPEDSEPEN